VQGKIYPCGIVDEDHGATLCDLRQFLQGRSISSSIRLAACGRDSAHVSKARIGSGTDQNGTNGSESSGVRTQISPSHGAVCDTIASRSSCCITRPITASTIRLNAVGGLWSSLEWRPADRCGDDARMGEADDVERVEAGYRAQPQSLYKRRVAEQGGDAGGGSTLGTQSTFAQMDI